MFTIPQQQPQQQQESWSTQTTLAEARHYTKPCPLSNSSSSSLSTSATKEQKRQRYDSWDKENQTQEKPLFSHTQWNERCRRELIENRTLGCSMEFTTQSKEDDNRKQKTKSGVAPDLELSQEVSPGKDFVKVDPWMSDVVLALDQLEASTQDKSKLERDLDQVNSDLGDTLRRRNAVKQDQTKRQRDTVSPLEESEPDKAKLQYDLGRANANLRETLRQLALVQQEKDRLRADLKEANVEHDETLGRLKAANQREAKLRDAALGQSHRDAAIHTKSQNCVFLLMEQELTTTREQLESIKQKMALLAKRSTPTKLKPFLQNKPQVLSVDDEGQENSFSKKQIFKVSRDKPKGTVHSSKGGEREAGRSKNPSGPQTSRYNPTVSRGYKESSGRQAGGAFIHHQFVEVTVQNEMMASIELQEVDYWDI
jgi:hypothetical protein